MTNVPLPKFDLFLTKLLTTEKIKRVFIVLFILSVINSINPTYQLLTKILPVAQNFTGKTSAFVEKNYPQPLEIKIKNGIVSTNVTEPFYVSINSADLWAILGGPYPKKSIKTRILAIDTNGRAEDFERYQSLALLTKYSLVMYRDGDIKIYSLRNITDLTINKAYVIDNVNKFYQFQKFLPLFVVLAIVGIFVAVIFGLLISVLFNSIGFWVIARILQRSISFGRIITYTIYIFLPLFIFNLASSFFGPKTLWSLVGYLLSFIIFAVGYYGIKKYNPSKSL